MRLGVRDLGFTGFGVQALRVFEGSKFGPAGRNGPWSLKYTYAVDKSLRMLKAFLGQVSETRSPGRKRNVLND